MTKEQLRDYKALIMEKENLAMRLEKIHKKSNAEQKVMRTLEECYMDKLRMATQAILDIENAIDTLSPVERELVRLRYVDDMDWKEVAAKINYSWQQTHRIHAKALDKLEQL